MTLTAKEWLELPEGKRLKRGKELSENDCYLLRSLYDVPKAISIGHVEFTKEEKEKSKADLERIMREFGDLGENENFD